MNDKAIVTMSDEATIFLTDRVDLFAETRPDETALIDGKVTATWQTVASRMSDWANRLSASGAAPGTPIGLLTGNIFDGICSMLGILKCGAYPVFLPKHASQLALSAMVDDSGMETCLIDPALLFGLETDKVDSIPLITNKQLADWQEGHVFTRPDISPGANFNCVYSSGTTSRPKGILQSHQLRGAQIESGTLMGIEPGKVSILSTPLDSDTTIVGLVGALGNGAAIVLMEKFSPERFVELSNIYRTTHTIMVPVQYERILDSIAFTADPPESIEVSICTGAPLPIHRKGELAERWPGEILEVYGLTEGGATTLLSLKGQPEKHATVGMAFPGAELRIIDDGGVELSANQVGEIVGRDKHEMTGYTDEEAQSSVHWIASDGLRFLRTGDLGSLDEDGFLTVQGRKKDMLISGGFNVYPRDIEDVISRQETIRDVAVVGRPDERWGEVPIAFVVLKAPTDLSVLRDTVNAQLSKTQRVADVFAIDEVPRNAGGNADKVGLRRIATKEASNV